MSSPLIHRRSLAPATVLLLIRDRVANDWPSLCREFGMAPQPFRTLHGVLQRTLCELEAASLIQFERSETPVDQFGERGTIGRIEVSPQWERIQTALGVSLVEISELGHSRSMVAKPYFGPPSTPPHNSDVFVLMPFTEE